VRRFIPVVGAWRSAGFGYRIDDFAYLTDVNNRGYRNCKIARAKGISC
jgi:hypothetical protein